uniref:Uncharacterized protein n=1 Tax=Anopheles coluzzii TaxID=1518534 RepID=A0A8W7PTI8_ANOCL
MYCSRQRDASELFHQVQVTVVLKLVQVDGRPAGVPFGHFKLRIRELKIARHQRYCPVRSTLDQFDRQPIERNLARCIGRFDDGTELQRYHQFIQCGLVGLDQVTVRNLTQRRHQRGRVGCRPGVKGRSAVGDGALEQSHGQRGQREEVYQRTASRLAEDGHAASIATERTDVPLYPAQRLNAILDGPIARCTPIARTEESQHTESIVERYNDHIFRHKVARSVQCVIARAANVSTAFASGVGQLRPCWLASRTPVQAARGTGSAKRKAPTGGSAYGMPLKEYALAQYVAQRYTHHQQRQAGSNRKRLDTERSVEHGLFAQAENRSLRVESLRVGIMLSIMLESESIRIEPFRVGIVIRIALNRVGWNLHQCSLRDHMLRAGDKIVHRRYTG